MHMYLRGILALAERSFRMDIRQWMPGVLRATVVLMAGFAAGCVIELSQSTPFFSMSAGRTLIMVLTHLNVVFILMAMNSVFAGAIADEKEAGTLGLLLLTGLSPMSILLGKSVVHVWQVLLLLLLQLPLMLLAITLGGVTLHQVLATLVSLMAFALFGSQFAVLMSVLFRTKKAATGYVHMMIVAYWATPNMLRLLRFLMSDGTLVVPSWCQAVVGFLGDATRSMSTLWRWETILVTGFDGSLFFNAQVISHLVVALGCLGLAWQVFPWATRDPEPAADGRGLGAPSTRKSAQPAVWSAGRPGGMGWRAIAWHHFYFQRGGWVFLVGKLCGYLAFFGLMLFMADYTGGRSWTATDALTIGMVICLCGLSVELMFLAGSMFQNELKHQTWWALQLLPCGVSSVAYGKLLGTLWAASPGLLLLAVCFVPTVASSVQPVGEILAVCLQVMLGYLALLHFITYVSTGRQGQGSYLELIFAGMVVMGAVVVMSWLDSRNILAFQHSYQYGIQPLLAIWCIASHPLIARRLAVEGSR
jgi:hypothetical protein